MTASKYPRIGEKRKWFDKHRRWRCLVCGERGIDQRIDIQVGWFRGEDEVIYVHANCAAGKTATELLAFRGRV